MLTYTKHEIRKLAGAVVMSAMTDYSHGQARGVLLDGVPPIDETHEAFDRKDCKYVKYRPEQALNLTIKESNDPINDCLLLV